MAAQNSPFVEATYGWPYGSNGWDGDMNTNLVKFSYLHDRNIDAIVSSLPAIVNGKAYFNTADNRLYFDANGQRYSSVTPKWFEVTLRTTGQVYQFDGTTLNLVPNGVAYTDTLRGDIANSTNPILGSAMQGHYDPFAPGVQKDTSDILNGLPVSVLRAVPVEEWPAIMAGTSNYDVSSAFTNLLALVDEVFVPQGCRVFVGSTVQVGAKKRIYGAGGSSRVFVPSGVTAFHVGTPGVVAVQKDWLDSGIIENLHFVSDVIDAGTIAIRVHNASSGNIRNIRYTKLDKVISQGRAEGFVFDNISNFDLEDNETDCNYVIWSDSAGRSNDNVYKNCIARAKLGSVYLSVTSGGQHDGASVVDNIFFPTISGDTIYADDLVWSHISRNKCFVPARHGINLQGSFRGSEVDHNLIAWPGRFELGHGVNVLASAGSTTTAYGNSSVSANIIVQPSGSGIKMVGLKAFNVAMNNIVNPNDAYYFNAGAFTQNAIDLDNCHEFSVSANAVTIGRDQRSGAVLKRTWLNDVRVASTCRVGVVDHVSLVANIDSSVDNKSNEVRVVGKYLPVQKEKLTFATAFSSFNPYITTGWSSIGALAATIEIDAVTPNPIRGNGGGLLKFNFTSGTGTSALRRGINNTIAGQPLTVNFSSMATVAGVYTWVIAIGANSYSGTFVSKAAEWSECLISVVAQTTEGFATLTIQSTDVGGTLLVAGLHAYGANGRLYPTGKVFWGPDSNPASGIWHVGDEQKTETKTAGGFMGRVCTVIGTPGTWKTHSPISA